MTRHLQKRPTKETYKRDLLEGLTTEICVHDKTLTGKTYERDILNFQTHKRDLFISKETCKRDLQKRPIKETYNRDLMTRHLPERLMKETH